MSTIDQQFGRFQKTRDARDLARVFDATAKSLLEVARHVARDPVEAQDLLQATFLTAIEVADRYRPGHSV